jgi:hypothetical protein
MAKRKCAIITDKITLLKSFKLLFIVEVTIHTLIEVKMDGFISA